MKTTNMLARVQQCHHCRREMPVTPLSYRENPFCNVCLEERMRTADAQREPMEWVEEGKYVVFRPRASQTTSSDE